METIDIEKGLSNKGESTKRRIVGNRTHPCCDHEVADAGAPTAWSISPRLDPQAESRDAALPWFDVSDEEFVRECGERVRKESQRHSLGKSLNHAGDAQHEHEWNRRCHADPFVRNSRSGETTLHAMAKQLDGAGLILRLLQAGVPVDVQDHCGWTPLHVAAQAGQEAICRVLLAHNARPDIRNVDGDAPLSIAIRAGQASVAKILLTVPDAWSGEWDDHVFRSIVECVPSAATAYLDAFVGPELCTDNSLVASSEFRALAAIYGNPDAKDSALTWVIASPLAPEIVKHRVIRHIIRAKQHAVGDWLRLDLALYLTLMITFLLMLSRGGRAGEFTGADWRLYIAVVVLCVYFAWIELEEFRAIYTTHHWLVYFKSPGNMIDVITMTTTFMSCALLLCPHWNGLRMISHAVASIFLSLDSWKRLALGGILVTMVGRMVQVALGFLFLLYVPICCGFAGAFNALLSGNQGFSGYGESIVTTIEMLLGNVDWDGFGAKEAELGATWHQQFAHVLLLVYQFVTTIVLLNFLVAFMMSRFDRVRADSEAKDLHGLAATLQQREAILSESRRRAMFQRLKTKRTLAGEILLQDGLHSYPRLRDAKESIDANVAKLDGKATEIGAAVTDLQTQTQKRLVVVEDKSAAHEAAMKALDSKISTLSSQMTQLHQHMQELLVCLRQHPQHCM